MSALRAVLNMHRDSANAIFTVVIPANTLICHSGAAHAEPGIQSDNTAEWRS
jgi:hypothetical protein